MCIVKSMVIKPKILLKDLHKYTVFGPETDKVCCYRFHSYCENIENCYLKLTPCEFLVLETLCDARGQIVPREKLAALLGADSGNLVDVYVCHLRRKLERPLNKKLIFSKRGLGYITTLRMEKAEK